MTIQFQSLDRSVKPLLTIHLDPRPSTLDLTRFIIHLSTLKNEPTHIFCDSAKNFMHWHSSYISIYSILIQGLHGERCPIVCRRKQKIPFTSLKNCLLIGQQIRVNSKLGLSESGIFKSWMNLTIPVWTKCGVNKWKFTPKVSCGYLSLKKN